MQGHERGHKERIAFENGQHAVDSDPGARLGECDTPDCREDAETFTPVGYVCVACLGELERAHDEARERDLDADREVAA